MKEKGWQKSNFLNDMQTNTTSIQHSPPSKIYQLKYYLGLEDEPVIFLDRPKPSPVQGYILIDRFLIEGSASGISLYITERARFLPFLLLVQEFFLPKSFFVILVKIAEPINC